MPDTTYEVDLSPYLSGLPKTITREYLQGLSSGDHANLVRKVESNLASLRDETIRAQAAIAQRDQEAAAIVKEAQEENGISTLEEASQKLAEAEDHVLACWQDVAAAMASKG